MKFAQLTLIFLLISTHMTSAFAYVGPGLGVGALAAVIGLLVGFVMLLVGVVWYPIKRLIKRLASK